MNEPYDARPPALHGGNDFLELRPKDVDVLEVEVREEVFVMSVVTWLVSMEAWRVLQVALTPDQEASWALAY